MSKKKSRLKPVQSPVFHNEFKREMLDSLEPHLAADFRRHHRHGGERVGSGPPEDGVLLAGGVLRRHDAAATAGLRHDLYRRGRGERRDGRDAAAHGDHLLRGAARRLHRHDLLLRR